MNLKKVFFTTLVLGAAGLGYILISDEFGRPQMPARVDMIPRLLTPPPMRDPHRAEFTICAGPVRANCVVDGDTFWFEGIKIRIADIDAPEVSEPACVEEAEAGKMATDRMLTLLNDGPFRLIPGSRDEDRFGRKLRIVARDDISLGEVLVREGLARPWGGSHFGWCSSNDLG